MSQTKKVLILSDGKMGHQNQSVRLVESLGCQDYTILKLRRRFLGKILSYLNPICIVKNKKELIADFNANNYDVVVGIGSSPRLAMLYLKKIKPAVKTICIMDPKANYEKYDVVAVPNHDTIKYKGDNLVRFTGSLSYFNQGALDSAKQDFKEEFKDKLENPLIGLIVGGDSKGYKFSMLKAKELMVQTSVLAAMLKSKVYATTSGRTPKVQKEFIRYTIEQSGNSIYTSGEKNPFRAILGYSSIIVITPETVSMLMEACSTKALVLVYDRLGVKSKRIKKFTQELIDLEYIYDIDTVLEDGNVDKYIESSKIRPDFKELEKVVSFIKDKIII